MGASSPRGAGAARLFPEQLQVPTRQLQAPSRSTGSSHPDSPRGVPAPMVGGSQSSCLERWRHPSWSTLDNPSPRRPKEPGIPGVRGNGSELASSGNCCAGSQASWLGGREAQSSFQRERIAINIKNAGCFLKQRACPIQAWFVPPSYSFLTHESWEAGGEEQKFAETHTLRSAPLRDARAEPPAQANPVLGAEEQQLDIISPNSHSCFKKLILTPGLWALFWPKSRKNSILKENKGLGSKC